MPLLAVHGPLIQQQLVEAAQTLQTLCMYPWRQPLQQSQCIAVLHFILILQLVKQVLMHLTI